MIILFLLLLSKIIIIMDDNIYSSLVFDKTNSRFTILNLYSDDEDILNENNLLATPEQVRKQFKTTIQKKEAFNTKKCYCSIM
jgi:hypothetical protein